jgi:hypothetical protein
MAKVDGEPRRRWRLLIGSVALGAAALGIAGGTIASATEATGGSPSGTAVVECSSGTITQGDIQMSALSVTKVPAGEHPDIPGGCVVRDAG